MRAQPPTSLVTAILTGALVGSVARGLANAAWVFTTQETARIRDDLESFVAARRVVSALGAELLRWTPVLLFHPMQTSMPGEFALFTSTGLLTDLALSAVVALPLAASTGFLRGKAGTNPEAVAAFTAGAFFLPFLYAPVRRIAPGIPLGPESNLVVWVLLSAVLALGGFLLLRRWAPPRALRRIAVAGSILAILAACTVIAHGSRDPKVTWLHESAPPRPNVILISIDSLRADHVGCYGYGRETTSNLDRLAAEGTRFADAIAPTSWTLPSHLALLTALPAESSRENPAGLRARMGTVTLAEVLRSAGYETAGFVGGPYLDSRYGFAQGFSVYDDFTVVAQSNPESHRGATSPELLRLAEDWLGRWHRAGSGRPFFLFWHLWDVHFDYEPPPPYDRRFDPDYEGTVDGRGFLGNPEIHRGMNPRDLHHVVALYDGEIAFTDAHIGQLVDLLQTWNILDDTLVVVTADHGDEFFEHGMKGHRKNLYDTTLAVPLIFRWPQRVSAGRVIEQPVGLLDVAPTILGLLGVGPPAAFAQVPALDGPASRDLSPLLSATHEAVIAPSSGRPLFADLHGNLGAVRTSGLKLIARFDPATADMPPELYDLEDDPEELRDLAAERPSDREHLLELLRAWRSAESGGSLTGVVSEDLEHVDRLRSLGYID